MSEVGAAIIRLVRPNGDAAPSGAATRPPPMPVSLPPDASATRVADHEPAES